MGGLGHTRALGSGTSFFGLGLGHALSARPRPRERCDLRGAAPCRRRSAWQTLRPSNPSSSPCRHRDPADAHPATKNSCGMTTTRLERIHHRGELKEHRAGKDHDDSQDNHLAHRQVSNRQQPGTRITPARMPATTNTKSTTRKGVSGCEMRQIRADARRARRKQAHGSSVRWLKAKYARHKDIECRSQNDRNRRRQRTLARWSRTTLHAGIVGLKPNTKPARRCKRS